MVSREPLAKDKLLSNLQVNLFSSFTVNLVVVVSNVFLPLLAYQMGAGAFEVGLVGGVSYALYSFMPFLMGRLGSRLKIERLMMFLALAFYAVITLLYATVSNPSEIIMLRALEGTAMSMFWPAVDTEIGRNVSRDAGKSFSIFNTAWSSAQAIAPFVGVGLIFLLTRTQSIFWVMGSLLLIAAATNLVPLKRGRSSASPISISSSGLGKELRDPARVASVKPIGFYRLGLFVASLIFCAAVRGVLFTFVPTLAQSVGVSLVVIGTITFAFGGARLVTYVANTRDDIRRRILDERHTTRNIALCSIATSLAGTLPIFPDKSGLIYLVSFIVIGVSMSTVVLITQVGMIAGASPERMARNAGVFESCFGSGSFLGPVSAGLIAGGSLTIPFFIPLLGLLFVLPLLGRLRRLPLEPARFG